MIRRKELFAWALSRLSASALTPKNTRLIVNFGLKFWQFLNVFFNINWN